MVGLARPWPTPTIRVAPSRRGDPLGQASATNPSPTVATPMTMSRGSPYLGTRRRMRPLAPGRSPARGRRSRRRASARSQWNRSRRKRLNVPSSAAKARTTRAPSTTSRPHSGECHGVDDSTPGHHRAAWRACGDLRERLGQSGVDEDPGEGSRRRPPPGTGSRVVGSRSTGTARAEAPKRGRARSRGRTPCRSDPSPWPVLRLRRRRPRRPGPPGCCPRGPIEHPAQEHHR